jgi:hypothetical protein
MPPAWISRAASKSGALGNSEEIKKILGEPIPRLADPKDVPPDVMEKFASGGLLERLRKKLSIISRKKGGKILPAHNTIASVDEDDNLYVGVEFLEQFGDDEDLVAAVLAHEWGHMLSDLPRGVNWSHLTWDELHAIRRDEEADADGFAGRALFLMNYKPESMMKFLKALDKQNKNKKLPNHKYHNTATRMEILKQSWEAEKKAMEVARRLFFAGEDNTTGAKVGLIISQG